MQLLFSVALIVAGLMIILMICLVKDPTHGYYAGLTVVLLYSYVAVGIRFRYTLIIGSILIGAYFLSSFLYLLLKKVFLLVMSFF